MTDLRRDSWQAVKDLDAKEKELLDCFNKPEEGETLSRGIMELPDLLRKLGENLAEYDDQEIQLEDHYKFMREKITDEYMGEGSKSLTKTAAETKARLDERYLQAREEWRKTHKATSYLRVKMNSSTRFLEASRSRLSWIKQDISNA